MLIVICGAGASYDSVPSHPPKSSAWADIDRLPLADELFDVRPEFVRMMNQFPACLPIIPNLQHLAAGSSVESELEELQKEAKTNLRRNEQLSAIRFYLQGMIWECEDRWRTKVAQGRTNYRTMLDRIEHWRATQKPHPPSVCFITFNYDRMLEDALSTLGIRTETLEDYVADDVYKLVKLHGSVNWVRTIKVRIPLLQMENNPFQLANELIANSSLLSIGPIDRIVSSYPMSIERSAIPFPAMAIPLQSKSGEY